MHECVCTYMLYVCMYVLQVSIIHSIANFTNLVHDIKRLCKALYCSFIYVFMMRHS